MFDDKNNECCYGGPITEACRKDRICPDPIRQANARLNAAPADAAPFGDRSGQSDFVARLNDMAHRTRRHNYSIGDYWNAVDAAADRIEQLQRDLEESKDAEAATRERLETVLSSTVPNVTPQVSPERGESTTADREPAGSVPSSTVQVVGRVWNDEGQGVACLNSVGRALPDDTPLYAAPVQSATERNLDHGELSEDPQWIVNDLGELGVMTRGRFFFLYKGSSIEYGENTDKDGIALHDDGRPMRYRIVGKREFGETCQPLEKFRKRWPDLYEEPLVYTPGLSSGKPSDGDWRPLPAKSVRPEEQREILTEGTLIVERGIGARVTIHQVERIPFGEYPMVVFVPSPQERPK